MSTNTDIEDALELVNARSDKAQGRTLFVLRNVLEAIRGSHALQTMLGYDPATDVGRDAPIYQKDPPDDRRPPIAITVDVNSEGSDVDNAAHEQLFTVAIELQATKAAYRQYYPAGGLTPITDELESILEEPSIPGLRYLGSAGFFPTESNDGDVSREQSAEFNYAATRLYRDTVAEPLNSS